MTIDFSNLGFDDFRRMALDNTLSQNEKIGFPDSYRQGFEERIFEDINKKLTNLDLRKKTTLTSAPDAGHWHICSWKKAKIGSIILSW